MPIVSDVIKRLNEQYKPDEYIATAIWCEEDVIGFALNEMGKEISREQAQSILDQIDANQDCELGITWETIRSGIEALTEKDDEQLPESICDDGSIAK
jgi:hypothetical protein